MNVFVVMGNDYPAAVFSNETDAEAYCIAAKAKHEREMRQMYGERGSFPSIYYRSYEFAVDAETVGDPA